MTEICKLSKTELQLALIDALVRFIPLQRPASETDNLQVVRALCESGSNSSQS